MVAHIAPRRWGDFVIWHLQLADLGNFREEKQSVSTAHTEDTRGEAERKAAGECGGLNWDKDKMNSVDLAPLGFLTLHSVPVLPSQMLPGIKQKVYHG